MNHVSNELIKIARELIARELIAKSITIQNSVIDYIWNKIKNQKNTPAVIYGNIKNSKRIQLTSEQLQGLFNCKKHLNALTIIIANKMDLEKEDVPFWLYEAKKKMRGNLGGFYNFAKNLIVVYYNQHYNKNSGQERLLEMLFKIRNDDILVRNKNTIKERLKHQLIHYYKDVIDDFVEQDYNSKDFDKYINSNTQYDSWVTSVALEMASVITDIEFQNNKIKRIYTFGGRNNGITWKTFVKTFLTRHKFKDNFLDFLKKGKKDIIKTVQKQLLYEFKARHVYNNIEEAKKDVENNYYNLYKAINKNLIRTNNKIIIEIVKCLLKNNKIECIATLYKKDKLNNFMDKIKDLFEQYKNNKKIYFKLIQFGLVKPNNQYNKYKFNIKLNGIKDLDQFVNFYIDTDEHYGKLQKTKILNKALEIFDAEEQDWFFNKLNRDIDFYGQSDGTFCDFCKKNEIQLQQLQNDDDLFKDDDE